MKLPISYLTPGMILARPVYGQRGVLLLNRGVSLTSFDISALRRHGVLAVYVEGPLSEEELRGARTVMEEEIRVHTMNVVRSWAENGLRRANFASVVEQVKSVIDEILAGKMPAVALSEISAADSYTFAHSVDVCVLSVATGVRLGYRRDELLKLGIGALLHDLGKSRVPPEILNKPGKLTPSELNEIKKHPVWGYKMLREEMDEWVDSVSATVVLNHHERYDGSGYPRGLKGKNIHLTAAVCAAADMYNAITTDRVYRPALPPHEAYEMLMGAGGSALDFRAVTAFLSCVDPYPPGTLVRLSSGDIAVVLSNDPALPFRPVVLLVATGETIDMRKELALVIKEPLPPEEAHTMAARLRSTRAAV
ncbi:MAG: HD-GYP domain-containing protein [Moorellaceae bacterium]